MLNRQEIAARLPHQGTMCLLDEVIEWDEETIICRTTSHQSRDNPLIAANQLGIATIIEYAAQAMAIHAMLINNKHHEPEMGFLTSTRNIRWYRQRIDDIHQPLTVHARCLSSNRTVMLYTFDIYASEERVAQGRISAMLNTTTSSGPSN